MSVLQAIATRKLATYFLDSIALEKIVFNVIFTIMITAYQHQFHHYY